MEGTNRSTTDQLALQDHFDKLIRGPRPGCFHSALPNQLGLRHVGCANSDCHLREPGYVGLFECVNEIAYRWRMSPLWVYLVLLTVRSAVFCSNPWNLARPQSTSSPRSQEQVWKPPHEAEVSGPTTAVVFHGGWTKHAPRYLLLAYSSEDWRSGSSCDAAYEELSLLTTPKKTQERSQEVVPGYLTHETIFIGEQVQSHCLLHGDFHTVFKYAIITGSFSKQSYLCEGMWGNC